MRMKRLLFMLSLCLLAPVLQAAEGAATTNVWKDATVYPITSKLISWAYYEPLTQTLTLGIGQSAMEYYQVPRPVFEELLNSRQSGAVYQGKIRTRYKHRNVKFLPVKK